MSGTIRPIPLQNFAELESGPSPANGQRAPRTNQPSSSQAAARTNQAAPRTDRGNVDQVEETSNDRLGPVAYTAATAGLAAVTGSLGAAGNCLLNVWGSSWMLPKPYPFHGGKGMAPYAIEGAASGAGGVVIVALVNRAFGKRAAQGLLIAGGILGPALAAADGAASAALASALGYDAQTVKQSAAAASTVGAFLIESSIITGCAAAYCLE